jgi:uncharacterized protein (TIGR02646 family)
LIRVVKPDSPPKILRDENSRGPRATRKLERAYDQGERDFEFDSGIYAAKSVKNALIKAQHGKCCFCESRVLHVDYGDVEHFRPKGGFRQKESDALSKPGYYWLAYDWSNLFLSCALCNQRYKGNLFPLLDPSKRARSHRDDIRDEQPLFIHASADDPEKCIGFRAETPYAIGGSRRGRATIGALALDRPELQELRRRRLAEAMRSLRTVRVLKRLLQQLGDLNREQQSLLEEHEAALKEYRDAATEYSSMLKAALS